MDTGIDAVILFHSAVDSNFIDFVVFEFEQEVGEILTSAIFAMLD